MVILQAAAIALTLSVDAFAASFAYGTNKVKIPMLSIHIINFICVGITALALLAEEVLERFIPEQVSVGISFTILFSLGFFSLMDSITKSIIRKHREINKEIQFSLFNFRFILNLYADPVKADVDNSNTLSAKEAVSLAVALSLDGIAVGFGAALAGVGVLSVIVLTLIVNGVALFSGQFIGRKLARKLRFNVSWLSGGLLIVLAFLQLF